MKSFGDLISYKKNDLMNMQVTDLVDIILWLKDIKVNNTGNEVNFNDLFKALGPFYCDLCGAELRIRQNRKEHNLFLGCSEFHKTGCKGSIRLLKYANEKFFSTDNAYNRSK